MKREAEAVGTHLVMGRNPPGMLLVDAKTTQFLARLNTQPTSIRLARLYRRTRYGLMCRKRFQPRMAQIAGRADRRSGGESVVGRVFENWMLVE